LPSVPVNSTERSPRQPDFQVDQVFMDGGERFAAISISF
jgi:hypothetical protein